MRIYKSPLFWTRHCSAPIITWRHLSPITYQHLSSPIITYHHLAALGAARIGLFASLDPARLLVVVEHCCCCWLFVLEPSTILVGLSMQMFAPTIRPTGLPASVFASWLLVPPWLEPRMLHNFTSSLASSMASLLVVGVMITMSNVIMVTMSNDMITLVEVEAEHSSGD